MLLPARYSLGLRARRRFRTIQVWPDEFRSGLSVPRDTDDTFCPPPRHRCVPSLKERTTKQVDVRIGTTPARHARATQWQQITKRFPRQLNRIADDGPKVASSAMARPRRRSTVTSGIDRCVPASRAVRGLSDAAAC